MVKTECAEQRPRFECEPLPGGATLIRLYEDEQEVTREAVSIDSCKPRCKVEIKIQSCGRSIFELAS